MNIEYNQFAIAFEEAPFDNQMEERLQKILAIAKLWPTFQLSTRFKGFYEIYKKAKGKLPYYDFGQSTIEGYIQAVLGLKNPVLIQAYASVVAYVLYCNLPCEINVADDCVEEFNCFTTFATKTDGDTFYELQDSFVKVAGWDSTKPNEGLPDNHNLKLVIRNDGALHDLSEYKSEDGKLKWDYFINVFTLGDKKRLKKQTEA